MQLALTKKDMKLNEVIILIIIKEFHKIIIISMNSKICKIKFNHYKIQLTNAQLSIRKKKIKLTSKLNF